MGAAQEAASDLVEQCNYFSYESKDRSRMVDGGLGLDSSEVDESKTKVIAEDVNNGPEGVNEIPDGLQKPQLQPRGLVVWERFLPIRSLKVLLVENDDSTRHVVSALLRNCSYEVTAVANGLQAWNVLEDLTNHIDLILTEVVMPLLTGIGLLCKIMNHKTLKNIPVIMMSSHDSMGIVFKCLSKGAVDFLVKPIRKNELKNLWQHVWRRCHSSSGSGSESGTQTKRSAKSKSNESGNNSDSSDERDYGSIGLSLQDGSDNGSGTQSSWTKRRAEFDSPQPLSPLDPLADAPYSTCAQVIHTKPDTLSDSWLYVTKTRESQEQDEHQIHVAMGKDLDIGVSKNVESPAECSLEKFLNHPRGKHQNKLPDIERLPFNEEKVEHKVENVGSKMREQDINLMNQNVSRTAPPGDSRATDTPAGLSEITQRKDKVSCDSREMPFLELSLRKLRGAGDVGIATHAERNILRHSDFSAFSKYNNASSSNQGPTGNVGSCSPIGDSSVAMKIEPMHNCASNSNPTGTPPNIQSNESSNNNDMASTTKPANPNPDVLNDESESTSAFRCSHSSTFPPTQDAHISHSQQVLPVKEDDLAVNFNQDDPRGSHLHVQVQLHHHHYHHYHHHVHRKKHQSDHDDCSLKNMAALAPQCGSSNVFGGPGDGNAGTYSVNGSASGSNHGSNGQNGSTALNAGVANMESDNGIAGNSGTGGSSGRTSGNAGGEDRSAQREAALTKFRQKRKERCFEKKVRYHSRKRLAEQRPRVRGQFVRQAICDSKSEKDEQSSSLLSEDNSYDR